MSIIPKTLDVFTKDLKAAFASLEEKYDITICLGSIMYTSDQFSAKMTVKNSHAPKLIARNDFYANVWSDSHLGLELGMYKRIIISKNG